MADVVSLEHPRPVAEDDEPPTKQLKSSVEDNGFLSSRSPVHHPHGIAGAVGQAGEVTGIIENDSDNSKGSLLPVDANIEVSPIATSIREEGTSAWEPESVVPSGKAVVFAVENNACRGHKLTSRGVEDPNRQSISSANVINGLDVDPGSSSVEFSGDPDLEKSRLGPETKEDVNFYDSFAKDSNLNVSQASGATATETSRISGQSLLTDLGPGSAAVERTKTSLCSYFRKNGCRHGNACRYAHGEEELRPRPDGSWDPTSERAKSLLKKATADETKPAVEVPPFQVKGSVSREVDDSTANPLSKCIVNVPRGWSVDNLKKFLTENSINYTTAKKRKGMSVAFVGFKSAEDVEKAFEMLNGKTVGKKQLVVAESRSRSSAAGGLPNYGENILNDGTEEVTSSVVDDDGSDDGDVGDAELMAMSREGPAGEVRNVCNAVTPLAHMSYEEQLNVKRDNITQVLKRLVRNTRKGIPTGALLPEWILHARDKGGLPCALEGVLASPLVDGYRNKCEFTIGCSDTGEKVVGFQVGSFREGMLAVAEPADCRNVSIIGRSYAALFQEFVRKSDLPVWNKKNNSGFWRLFTVREGRSAQCENVDGGKTSDVAEVMLVVQVCPTGIGEDRMTFEYKRMAEFLSAGANCSSPPMPLTALLVQDHAGISNVFPPDAPLHPIAIPDPTDNQEKQNEFIHEHLNNLQFRISPTAFFQVNTLAAERLYNVAGDWAGLTPDTILFDVCCGTGTIGLTLAHRVGLVVGIEMNASAVEDARKNAEINDIKNCQFVCGKAEDVMDRLLKEYLAPEGTPVVRDVDGQSGGSDGSQSFKTNETQETLSNAIADDVGGDTLSQAGSIFGSKNSHEEDATDILGSEKPLDHSVQDQNAGGRKFTNVVAIVDPPRVGLHPTVLKTLRLHGALRRLVYISCNPESMLANAVELCTLTNDSKDEKGKGGRGGRHVWKRMSNVGQARHRVKKMPPSEPFSPVKAVAVDLFPHTDHCEMVMLFQR